MRGKDYESNAQEAADELARLMIKIGKHEVRVGFVGANATAPADPEGDPEMTLARLAAILEFGTDEPPGEPGHIPERAFMRSTVTARRQQLAKLQKKLLAQILEKKITVVKALQIIGAQYTAWIKATVMQDEGVPPPNAESTIEAKGSSRPLVDRGTLISHGVTYRVSRTTEAK